MSIIPTYTEQLPDGRVLFGLTHSDFEKVRLGYGCPDCLEDYNGVYQAVCPVCRHARDIQRDLLEQPPHWLPDPTDPDRRA